MIIELFERFLVGVGVGVMIGILIKGVNKK